MSHADGLQEFLSAFRRDLHQSPEIGGHEYRTSVKIKEALLSFGFSEDQLETGIVGTGIVATVKGKYPGPVIMFRADMDALQNCEDLSGTDYASRVPGVCHACGHDVHSAVGVGTAKLLLDYRQQLHGTAKFFFQPSEELPVRDGADSALPFDRYTEMPSGVRAAALAAEEGLLQKPPAVDRLLGMHCWPSLPAGQIGYESYTAMAGSGNFHLAVIGQDGHAGMPQDSVDAIVLAAQVITALQTTVSRNLCPSVPVVLNIGTVQGGTRRSTVAGQVDMTGTVRCADRRYLDTVVPTVMERIIKGVCESACGRYQFDYAAELPPLQNDPETLIRDIAVLKRVFPEAVVELQECPMTAEDFAFLSQQCPSVFLKLGTHNERAETQYPLHNGAFDVDERCLSAGVLAAGAIMLDYLSVLD